ncbi:endo-glucanase RCE3 [Dipodascopsis tothii]|uniref:endo-glucanase RCE3 n=1 Tax=Dipodascopsis tothii TaxID=44089 RepID=UPI0034CD438F
MAFRSVLVGALAVLPLVVAETQTSWGQCGGIGWTAPTDCAVGTSCTSVNDYYYQCVPQTSQAAGTQSLYGQCGGSGYASATACPAGAACSSLNEYYYQCLPTTAATTTLTAAVASSAAPTSASSTLTTKTTATAQAATPASSSSTETTAPSSTKAASSSKATTSSASTASSAASSSTASSAAATSSAPASAVAVTALGDWDDGETTRYWDCCKPSCSWEGKAGVTQPVFTCDANNTIETDFSLVSGCDGGSAYTCASNAPWAVTDSLAYGFAAVSIAGGTEASWCCACYELSFTSTAAEGKTMIVQATNTGSDLGTSTGAHFDLLIPGGGVGLFNGCSAQYGAGTDGWGARYGGVSSRDECDILPDALKDGCYFRWDWMLGADNPTISFREVTCPAELTAITGCSRT